MPTEKNYSTLGSLFTAHLILDALPAPVFIKNAELRYVFINKAYESMFGVKMEDMLGKTVFDLSFLPEKDREFYHNEDREMVLHQITSHHVFQYMLSDGKMHTCLYWSGGFTHENGSRGLVGIMVDITNQSKTIATLQQELRCLVAEKKKFEEKSVIDPLARMHNRGSFNELLRQFTISAIQDGNFFSCIMVDIDHFKKVNDTFGHLAGDDVLKNLARCLQDCSRDDDMLCRYGGEEFALLLPGCKLETALAIAERIRVSVIETVFLPDGTGVTVSAGCSEYVVGEEDISLIQRADEALYTAKRTGRNRVCSSQHRGYCLNE